MPRSDEIDISTGQGSGTGIDIGIGAGGSDGGFIEAVAQELDNAANNVGAGHPDWGMSGSAEPMSAEQAVANINAAGGWGGGEGWDNPENIGSGDWMQQHGMLDQDIMNQQEGTSGTLSDMLGSPLDQKADFMQQNESPIDASQAGADVNDFLSATRGSDIRSLEELGTTASTPNTFEDFIQQGANLSGTQQAIPTGGGQSWVNPNASFEELEAQFSTSPQVDPRAGTQHGFQTRALDEGISPPQISQTGSMQEKAAAVEKAVQENPGETPTSIIGKILSGVMQFVPGVGIIKALTGGLPQSKLSPEDQWIAGGAKGFYRSRTGKHGYRSPPRPGPMPWQTHDPQTGQARRNVGWFTNPITGERVPYGPPAQLDRTHPTWLQYGSEPDGPNPFLQKYPWLQQLPQRIINRAIEDGEFLRELIRAQEADELWLYMSEQ